MKKLSIFTIMSILLMGFNYNYTGLNKKKEPSYVCVLQLIGLECIKPEGFVTADAIYFKINGKNWGDKRLSMTKGSYYDLQGISYYFSGNINIQLWDDDTFDSDDYLGSVIINCQYSDQKIAIFNQDGAFYKLYYRVY